jgi:hypothetical protein
MRSQFIALCLLCSLSFAESLNLAKGDFHYSLRAENATGNMAEEKNVKEAIKYYTLALKEPSVRAEAAWKLLKAYYFLGCFATSNPKERKILFENAKKKGKDFSNEFLENTEIAYWYSVSLALWARESNSITIILNASSISETRKVAQMLIESEKDNNKIAAARGYQLMGGLHKKLPRIIPGIRKDSIEFYLKKSITLNPNDLSTILILAEYYKEDKKDANALKAILEPVLKNKPRPEELLEDERNFIKMRNLLK